MFIDTHTHLFLKNFKNDIDNVIENSIKSNVKKFLLPNIDSTTINDMLRLVQKYPKNCFPMIGVHPCSITKNYIKELEIIEIELKKNKYYAIGEIGIDLYWEKKYINEQKKAFDMQIKIALKHNLPLVIHIRNSFDEVFEILEKTDNKNIKGVFHCFSGNEQQAKKAISLGFKLGVGGIITYKNSNLNNVLKNISLNNIMLETDSPYLAPNPYRGKRNESSYIPIIANKIAEIYNCDVDQVAKITTKNAETLFNI